MNNCSRQAEDYERIEKAIQFIEANFRSQPGLEEIAASVYMSKYHFERIFKKWAGISPIQFKQFLTLDYTKQKLSESRSLLETSLEAGLSGPARLHDLFVTFEAFTPGEFKRQGRGIKIDYGFCPSPFGECLLAMTARGICHLGFVQDSREQSLKRFFDAWPGAHFSEDSGLVFPVAEKIFTPGPEGSGPFNLVLKGTNFQINVWKALLAIPAGWVTSYQDIAGLIGRAMASRAVAGAIAVNPVAYLIPCHRVIAKSGKIHGFRWGVTRKKAMIGWEAARRA
ncbi:bifunctional helix-turn-helix domain-containing protein/methylated-DNA--[protein]-cysteine S-methyltransferase [Desulfospira joergensenii]|uniref:bifunctional helix-turn-helix domain-containing protein/methylated-DNA--[protein]-cysteine S-methyltransferase n=1 Tax=Desulfospira joergensenii TaxID=53329 RepID=UPI0003B6F5F1|nr:methylated-DNA--[protein]-cysteine S-methyltransferase [Desulfospira joergensenii]